MKIYLGNRIHWGPHHVESVRSFFKYYFECNAQRLGYRHE